MKEFKFDKKTDNLFDAILSLKNITEAEMFFRDLCTAEEIKDMSDRLEIAKMIDQGISYRKIAEKTKTSTTTVSRVSFWLNNGKSGYKLILNRINKKHHSPIST